MQPPMKRSPISFLSGPCRCLGTGMILSTVLLPGPRSEAAPYQEAVKNLGPTYYYELNAASIAGGAIDSMGNAPAPGTYNGDYVIGPAMVGGAGPLEVFGGVAVPGAGGAENLAHYGNNQGHIVLGAGEQYGANAMTVAFFMKAGPSQGGDRIFTNNLADPAKSFQVTCGNDGLILAVDPSATGAAAERTLYLEDNSDRDRRLINPASGWFHIVASTQGTTGPERASNLRLWVNGINRTANLQPDAVGWGVETGLAKIGGRGADPAAPQTHSGAQDDVSIWLDRVLTDAEVASLWAAARRLPTAGLSGWWPFEGDASDRSGRGLNGTVLGAGAFDADKPAGLTGQSILFSADPDGVSVPAHPALDSEEFTLGYFINLRGAAQGNAGLERLSSRQLNAFETAVGDAHALGGTVSPTGLTLSYYSPAIGWNRTEAEVPADGWMHVAWRNTAAGMDMFLNGALVYSGAAVPAGALSGQMTLGTRFDQIEGFEGLMDDAFLWGGALNDGDITTIAAGGISGFAGLAVDSDGDGLPDWWEIQNGLNAGDNGSVLAANGGPGDPDSDGLTNAQEFTRGTLARDADTDDDGLQDGAEITRGTNPLLADTDGDGLKDGDEVTRATNPLLVDTDGDSIGDGDEVSLGTNPLDPLSGPPPSAFLVLHLAFDGNTQDASPQANHGELLGSPELVNDSPVAGGQALWFTSNEMGVTVPESAALGSNAFTLSYWVKPTSLQEGAGLERLTSRSGDAFETAIGNAAAVGGAEELTLSYYQGTAGWIRTGVALIQDEWAHVAWRNRGSGPEDLDLFVNGQLVFTGVGVPAAGPGSGFMNIGTRHNGIEGFEGLMDDVRLYRAPLKDSDIAALAPPVAAAPFEIASIVRVPDGSSVTLAFSSRPGRTYAVDFSSTLNASGQPGGWTELTDAVASGGAQTVYVDAQATALPGAFYRVRDVTP